MRFIRLSFPMHPCRLTQLEDVKVPTPKAVLDGLPTTLYHKHMCGQGPGGSYGRSGLFIDG